MITLLYILLYSVSSLVILAGLALLIAYHDDRCTQRYYNNNPDALMVERERAHRMESRA